MTPTPPQLTPFIDARRAMLRDRFFDALWGLLDVPPPSDLELRAATNIGHLKPIEVKLTASNGMVMGLTLRRIGRREQTTWSLPGMAVTVKRYPNTDPMRNRELRALIVAMNAHLGPDAEVTAEARKVVDAFDAYVDALAVQDDYYRHVELAHDGAHAFMRLGFRCNQDCHFCWQGRRWTNPPDELFATWLDELASTGVKRLTLSGGEPTLTRSLPDLIHHAAHDLGMHVHMNTNAVKIADPAYAQTLVDAGLRSVMVSFHSADPEISDRMTRAPGTHIKTVAGLHNLLSRGVIVNMNCLVEKDNVATVLDQARYVRREFVERYPDNPVRVLNYSQPGPYYEGGTYTDNLVPIDVARDAIQAASRLLHDAGVLMYLAGTCGYPACIVADDPELVDWRPREAMDHRSVDSRRIDMAPCQTCKARSHCAGVRREYVELFGDRGLRPYQSLPSSDWLARLQAQPELLAIWSL